MTAADWVASWAGFLGVALAGAAVAEVARRDAARWLAGCLTAGGLAMVAMAVALTKDGAPQTVSMPAPWPALVLQPLPLAGLWSLTGGILFLAAVAASWTHPQRRQIFYGFLPLMTGVAVYLWAGHGLLLLVSWEFASAVTYLGLVGPRRSRPVWEAGWALLGLSELGGMLLLAALAWPPAPAAADWLMGLALLAFGVKAGLFPVMIWMPLAEPQAPGAVAGIYSGFFPGLAVSGLLAMAGWLHPGLAWAVTLLVLGVLGSLTGALYAIVSRHVKRVLAYSTLEVTGLVFSALGVWYGESLLAPNNVAATLALDAAWLLLVAHAGAKFALFAVTDYTGRFSHTLDHLGGLLRRAPRTGFWVLLAILVLAGFPPLGGFGGEWLLLEAIIKPLGTQASLRAVHLVLMVAGGWLALAMAIGVTAYLRWFGFAFLGPFRERPARPAAGEAPQGLRGAVAVAAAAGAAVGPAMPWLLPWLNTALKPWLKTPTAVLAPTQTHPGQVRALVEIGANLVPVPGAPGSVLFPQGFAVADPTVLLVTAVALGGAVAWARARVTRRVRPVTPWTGGAAPYSERFAFSAEGFVHPLRLAFAGFYGLRRHRFDRPGVRFYRHTIVYRVETQLYRPVLAAGRAIAKAVQMAHRGALTRYLGWLAAAVLVAWAAAFVR